MNNFSFANPVKIIFGKETIKEISKEIPAAAKVLVIYGGGSIKRNGVYNQVTDALKEHTFFEFSGIEANPHYETCMQAVALIKEKKCDFLLAVGGGSVVDATKFIAAAACFDGPDPWTMVAGKGKIEKAMPFGVVLTLSATGSEMNCGAVITKAETQDKLAFHSSLVYPKFSVLDPTTTFTLPPKQTSNGVIDTFVHVVEQYVTYPVNAMLQDMFAESILKVLVKEGPKALKQPKDYDVRANLMWASTWGLNEWIAQGVPQDWATHMIGHELTALYGLDHAQTLAIVLPGLLKVKKEQKGDKILQMGEQVFGINDNKPQAVLIENTIQAVEDFFEEMQVKTYLSDYGLGQEAVDAVANRISARGWMLGEHQDISGEVVREILKLRL
ncbi:NADP-dependent alcohol dehydrogenase [Dysgonomonas sp. PH5-45]|uniref:iron-containing alcohol dehydrogenase n=1 Tax=unclassified Dysgonomonas TaxID=2630389 RepID=UPI002475EE5A|nr:MULTISPECIES: iron-containing alcohol dehydrogenase [unclassified Dysgonomonas]MDH6353859.1 NADP-dependent alcohol dehydrogenase [Dysgonomonas sp. PH5-45]MDH6386761.1 NADP-dependent alcohol dehydrogenase [Dysgonomonas sp. PH5-37]